MTCGGTGGHITPALAIADTIRENIAGAELLFVGAAGGMENELVTGAGYAIRSLHVKGLSRKLGISLLREGALAVKAIGDARALLREFAPDIVIGTGGYACYPTLFAATRMGIPTAVHESNAVPGLAVRMLAGSVDRVWVNFPSAGKRLSSRARVLTVGNPLPRGFVGTGIAYSLPAGCRRMILSFGGSLGAAALNRAVIDLMRAEREDVYHLHATGKGGYEEFMRAFSEAGLVASGRLDIRPFIFDMPRHMASATLVICRAGAMSISELAAAGRAAVLVPSPNVTGNHQYENAKALYENGAGVLLEERELVEGGLAAAVLPLLDDSARIRAYERGISAFSRPDANRRILEDMLGLCQKAKKHQKR